MLDMSITSNESKYVQNPQTFHLGLSEGIFPLVVCGPWRHWDIRLSLESSKWNHAGEAKSNPVRINSEARSRKPLCIQMYSRQNKTVHKLMSAAQQKPIITTAPQIREHRLPVWCPECKEKSQNLPEIHCTILCQVLATPQYFFLNAHRVSVLNKINSARSKMARWIQRSVTS